MAKYYHTIGKQYEIWNSNCVWVENLRWRC